METVKTGASVLLFASVFSAFGAVEVSTTSALLKAIEDAPSDAVTEIRLAADRPGQVYAVYIPGPVKAQFSCINGDDEPVSGFGPVVEGSQLTLHRDESGLFYLRVSHKIFPDDDVQPVHVSGKPGDLQRECIKFYVAACVRKYRLFSHTAA